MRAEPRWRFTRIKRWAKLWTECMVGKVVSGRNGICDNRARRHGGSASRPDAILYR
jgi:hypothetical protein